MSEASPMVDRTQPGDGEPVRGARRGARWLLVPLLLIGVFSAPLWRVALPAVQDYLDDSPEPLKTLRFVYYRGHMPTVERWGCAPSFIYAAAYAPFVGYWYVTGSLSHPAHDYPHGFIRPHEQMGMLVLAARLTGVLAAMLGTYLLGRALLRTAGRTVPVLLAVGVLIAANGELIFKFVATKPDGLMLVGLMIFLAGYAWAVRGGMTAGRAILMAAGLVWSISCKEQTAPAFVLPAAAVLLGGMRLPSPQRRTHFRAVGVCFGAILIFYALLNVVYAPREWYAHIQYWLSGPGKDPAVWAPSEYSGQAYFIENLRAIYANLGLAGSLLTMAAGALSVRLRPRGILMAWLPFLSYCGITPALAGYMPAYFMCPLPVLAVLPVAWALAAVRWEELRPAARISANAAAAGIVVIGLWCGSLARLKTADVREVLLERAARACLGDQRRVNLCVLGSSHRGASRLSYLGYRVDDRPLGELLKSRADLPDCLFIEQFELDWLRDFPRRPARAKAFQELTGYDYGALPDIEAIGFRLQRKIVPDIPAWSGLGYLGCDWPDAGYAMLVFARKQP